VPVDPVRGERILTFLTAEGLVDPRSVHRPERASLEELSRVHDGAYLEGLREPGALDRIFGFPLGDAEQDRALDVQRLITGGSILATRLALATRRPAVNLGGGLHHALRGEGRSFCIFNDVAVALAVARSGGFGGRVLVVDLDLHDGEGIRALLADDPGAVTFSIHNQSRAESPADPTLAIALGEWIGDAAYLACLGEALPPVVARAAPDLTFYLAGADPAADDALGDWKITPAGMLERDRLVVGELRRQAPAAALVVLLAGGYGENAWQYGARFLSWLAGGRVIEPSSSGDLTLDAYRRESRRLLPRELQDERGGVAGEDWSLDLDDVYGSLTGAPRQTRFLGYYSRHGLELALERVGLLERLRAMGYATPLLELDLDHPGGHTLRLYGGSDRRELLIEMRLRRDRRTLPPAELLAIEWLLLQNPRGRFRDGRPPLPGQRYPGLGLLREIIFFLIIVCERLGLDGIVFVPGHYHIAARGHRYLRFLDPVAEERFCALEAALGGLPLAEADRALEEGRVRDRQTGARASWVPAPMILPVSADLEERLGAGRGGSDGGAVAAPRYELTSANLAPRTP
jgi:acetoin utilization deacetylase AcuC-like enzyme